MKMPSSSPHCVAFGCTLLFALNAAQFASAQPREAAQPGWADFERSPSDLYSARLQPPPIAPSVPPMTPDEDDEDRLGPPARTPSPSPFRRPPTNSTTWRSQSLSRRPVTRLASIPKMFGDYQPMSTSLSIYNQNFFGLAYATDIASAGVGQRLKVLENNNAWPDNRIDFVYRHYHNALSSTPQLDSPDVNRYPVDSYTFSFERTFLDGDASLQVVMPFLGSPTLYASDPHYPHNQVSGGNVGNFGLVLKGLLYENGTFAFSGGLSVNAPIGSDVDGQVFDTRFHIDNEAWQVAPFAAFIWAPEGFWLKDFFMQGGIQYDMVAGGNTLIAFNGLHHGPLMQLVDPNLLFVDLTFGKWLWIAPQAPILTGVAGQVELHSANSGNSHLAVGNAGSSQFVFGERHSRIDNLNLTGGLRFMLFGNTTLGVSAVAPLSGRRFDAEVQAIATIFL